MLRAEWRVFVHNRRFLFISLGPLLMVIISALSHYVAAQVGLAYVTGYSFLVSSTNLYVVIFLPFLGVAMGSYLFMAEFNWHTIRRPFIEHVSRRRFILIKAIIAGVVLALLMLPYLLFTLLAGKFLFGFGPVLFEDVELSVGQSIIRPIFSYLWIGLIMYIFVIVGQIIILRTKNILISILGGILPFYIFVAFGDSLPLYPIRLLFQIPQHFLETKSYDTMLLMEVTQGLGVWAAIMGVLVILHVRLFQRQDVLIH